ncbi:MAG TPA: TIGR00269 family protein [Candidatus Bathyarchaeia archaeon]|nr:TIGR00269 family protein [Candidatus Bathyarchaeia archaeon]
MARCTFCRRKDAVYMRVYSGEQLCAKCFTESIEAKVKSTIAKHKMLNPDDRIAVAVSGGKDSVTLLHILARFEKLFPKASLCAVTVDEGIRGYRDEAIKLAVDNCQRLGVDHTLTSFKQLFGVQLDEIVNLLRDRGRSNTDTLSPCTYCGVLRRRALNLAARQAKADKLALAHNLDDEVQTILLNIMHGDAPRLARVKPVLEKSNPMFVPRVKPLCTVPEKEIAFYAYLKKIDFQSVPCPYALTAMRNDIRLMVNRLEEKHAGTKFTVLKSIERIRPALESYEKAVILHACRVCGEPTVGEICKPCEMLRKIGVR